MEKNGISQVYLIAYNPERAWAIFPRCEDILSKPDAKASLDTFHRVDVRCVASSMYDTKKRQVISREFGCSMGFGSERFEIDCTDWGDGNSKYDRLIQVLEQRLGRTGLTILVS